MSSDRAPPSGAFVAERLSRRLDNAGIRTPHARIKRIRGVLVYASLSAVAIGELCVLQDPVTGRRLSAEVVGFEDDEAILTPLGELSGLSTRAEVIPTGHPQRIGLGPGLLGRVIDPLGRFMDGMPMPSANKRLEPESIAGKAPEPMTRRLIDRPLPVGIRAIDGLITIARGQRMGIFGEPSAGKSTLLASIVRGATADVIVVALVGERGREVREFLDKRLPRETRSRTIAVVATSDRPAIERMRAAGVATRIAEYFRDRGNDVLLIMDSLTRYARAQREIGLAAGEPPTRRGYPPSLFAELPRLLERAGTNDCGSITGIYTVLTEGEAALDPVAEEVRAILDGHIVLSRELTERHHFPAIDVLASRSRLMDEVVSSRHRTSAAKVRRALALYRDVAFLLRVGEYTRGDDALTDDAIEKQPIINDFLCQRADESSAFEATADSLSDLVR